MEAITIKVGPTVFPAFVAGEVGKPAVIVIQEWWGVTDEIRSHAEKIASHGYRVLVPDIYKGKVGVDKEEAHHLMSALDFPGAVGEISDAAAHLRKEGSPKVGVTGFCMGGALTLGALAKSADICCGAPFYGLNRSLFADADLKAKPVQGHFGAEDNHVGFSDPPTGRKLETDLQAAGNADAQVFVYERVGHAFLNSSPAPFPSFEARAEQMGMPPYDAEQADLAWSRLFAFFDKHLKA